MDFSNLGVMENRGKMPYSESKIQFEIPFGSANLCVLLLYRAGKMS